MKTPWIPLHCHSYFSMMEGTLSIEDLVAKAAHSGLKALALTDTNGLYGWVEFVQACKRHDIQPLCGVFLSDSKNAAVLLAKNLQGYQRLCHLISSRHLQNDFSLIKILKEDREHLSVLSRDLTLLKELLKETGPQDLYGEILPKAANHELLVFLKKYSLKAIATNATWLGEAKDFKKYQLLRAIDENTTLDWDSENKNILSAKHNSYPITADRFFCDQAFMEYHLDFAPEALLNTYELAEELATGHTWTHHLGRAIFPTYEKMKASEAHFQLRWKAYQGARQRYGRLNQKITQRLDHELSVIRDKSFSHYFLVVEDIVSQAPRTCGRGSVAASLVSYCLGITHVDPIAHNLLFERFLSPGRVDPPDADIDFPWDERDQVLDYIFKKYGNTKNHYPVAMVANHVRLQSRAAFREVSKVMGMNEEEISHASHRLRKLTPKNIPEAWKEILSLSQSIVAYPRHLSVHCGGVVIVPDDLRNYVPIEPASKGLPIIQWEKDQAEDFGLVKLDILGNRSLAVIRDSLEAIGKNKNQRPPSFKSFNPIHDAKTQDLLKAGHTMGVFYVESPAMRSLQKKSERGDHEHLVIHSSLIRPAAQHYINEYIRRLRGGAYEALHPLMEDILQESYGIMVYQEDVTRVAMALAGFDADEANGLRKALSKKRPEKFLPDYQTRFLKGAQERGVSGAVITQVWQMILSFAGYSFCKPHSASYALVSFKSAYLRAHYPAEFMAAVIANGGGYYSTLAYLSECRRMGLKVLMPDINASQIHYTGQGKEIRVGFQQIKGLSEAGLKKIITRRTARPYQNLSDFMKRARLGKEETKTLILAGCFDRISENKNRPQLIWHLLQEVAEPKTEGLFEEPSQKDPIFIPSVKDYSPQEKLQHEIQSFGFPISQHPLEFYQDKLKNKHWTPAKRLKNYVGKRVTLLGWWITAKTVLTKNQEPMQFVSFEDLESSYETIFFPKVYERYALSLKEERAFLLTGKAEAEFGVCHLVVERVEVV